MRKEVTTGLAEYLQTPKKVVITNHVNPDGDAMGSALGLAGVLRKMDHDVTVIVPNDYPQFLKWLEGTKSVVVYEVSKAEANERINASDLLICLDYNAANRAGEMSGIVENSSLKKLMIDHHQQPEDFVDWMISDTSKCSTAQMVFEFIDALGKTTLINKPIGECIYTGILTDTGSFRFSSTTSETHRIVAHLLDIGVRPDEVYSHIFDANSISRLKLLGTMLEQMVVIPEKRAAILFLRSEQLDAIGFEKGDSEGFVNYGLSIEGIEFSAFLREDIDRIKMSLRSKGDIDVNDLARKYINGGGHKNAAGGMLELTMNDALTVVKNMIQVEL